MILSNLPQPISNLALTLKLPPISSVVVQNERQIDLIAPRIQTNICHYKHTANGAVAGRRTDSVVTVGNGPGGRHGEADAEVVTRRQVRDGPSDELAVD